MGYLPNTSPLKDADFSTATIITDVLDGFDPNKKYLINVFVDGSQGEDSRASLTFVGGVTGDSFFLSANASPTLATLSGLIIGSAIAGLPMMMRSVIYPRRCGISLAESFAVIDTPTLDGHIYISKSAFQGALPSSINLVFTKAVSGHHTTEVLTAI